MHGGLSRPRSGCRGEVHSDGGPRQPPPRGPRVTGAAPRRAGPGLVLQGAPGWELGPGLCEAGGSLAVDTVLSIAVNGANSACGVHDEIVTVASAQQTSKS